MKCKTIELEWYFFNPSCKVILKTQIKNLQNPKTAQAAFENY